MLTTLLVKQYLRKSYLRRTFCNLISLPLVLNFIYLFKIFSSTQKTQSVFELHGSQSMPGPLTSYDGPLTLRKIPGTEGAAVGPLTFVHHT